MTPNDTAENQTDAAIAEVELETVLKKAIDKFDSIASITISHLGTHERPGMIRVTVYTGEAEGLEDYLQLYPKGHKIAIEREDETLLVPSTVMATCGGPVSADSLERTTIYMNEDVLGAQPVALVDGLAYVQDKLENPDGWDQEHRRELPLELIQDYTDQ